MKRFRLYCNNQYYANREEYSSYNQTQPYSFEQYVRENLAQLKEGFRRQMRG